MVFFGAEQQNALFYTEQSINQRAAENQRFVISLVVERCIFIFFLWKKLIL